MPASHAYIFSGTRVSQLHQIQGENGGPVSSDNTYAPSRLLHAPDLGGHRQPSMCSPDVNRGTSQCPFPMKHLR